MKIPTFVLSFVNPERLKKIDRYLLLNHPRYWVTRIHYVAYYGLLANIALNLFILIFLQSQHIDEFLWYVVIFVIFAEAGVFIFWLIKQSLYNPEKEYGHARYKIALVEVLVYVLCGIIIASTSFTMTATAIYKTAHFVGIESSTDCNTFKESNKLKTGNSFYKQNICKDIKQYKTNPYSSTSKYHVYHAQDLSRIIFLNVGIILLIIRKYSSWRILGWIGAYILGLITIVILFAATLSPLIPFLNGNRGLLTLLLLVNLFIIIQSIGLIKVTKNKNFMLINLASLPISLEISAWLLFYYYYYDYYRYYNFPLFQNSFFIIAISVSYFFLSPFYKTILNRTSSLPKE